MELKVIKRMNWLAGIARMAVIVFILGVSVTGYTQEMAHQPSGQVDINTASAKQIAKTLKGIGMQRAKAIVMYREEQGPFKKIGHLTKIKGIGKKTLAKNKGRIVLESPAEKVTTDQETKRKEK